MIRSNLLGIILNLLTIIDKCVDNNNRIVYLGEYQQKGIKNGIQDSGKVG